MIPSTIDQGALAQAAAYATAFCFGFTQFSLKKIPSTLKPYLFVGLTALCTAAAYVALTSPNVWVQLLVASIGVSTGVTGGVSMMKEENAKMATLPQ